MPAPLTTLQVAPAPSSAEDASNTAAPSSAPPPAPVAKAEPLAVPSTPRPETADAGSLAQYRLQLNAAARRYKRYPRVAMENNWEGATEITMLIGLDGAIRSATIKTSSGYDVLDQQALEMFKRAQPIVPIPPALRGKQFAVVLRAIYNLKEEPDS